MAKLSPWIKHVMQTKRSLPKGTSLGVAMKKAASTYKKHKKGGAFEQGETSEAAEGTAEAELGKEAEFEEEAKGGRRRSRRHRGGRTRRTRRHR
jgi:hypothetical protein